jgi:hypothetical protein
MRYVKVKSSFSSKWRGYVQFKTDGRLDTITRMMIISRIGTQLKKLIWFAITWMWNSAIIWMWISVFVTHWHRTDTGMIRWSICPNGAYEHPFLHCDTRAFFPQLPHTRASSIGARELVEGGRWQRRRGEEELSTFRAMRWVLPC